MNKNDLVNKVCESVSLTKADAARAVDAVFESIAGALQNKSDVRLVGFGTFCVVERKATEGRNPRTGETIKIAAKSVPKFKPGKDLRECVAA